VKVSDRLVSVNVPNIFLPPSLKILLMFVFQIKVLLQKVRPAPIIYEKDDALYDSACLIKPNNF